MEFYAGMIVEIRDVGNSGFPGYNGCIGEVIDCETGFTDVLVDESLYGFEVVNLYLESELTAIDFDGDLG